MDFSQKRCKTLVQYYIYYFDKCWNKIKKDCKIGRTSHNRTVYASPPVGGSGYGLPRLIASLIPTANLRHIFAALDFASQSPYSGCKNVANSRNVMRNNFSNKMRRILAAHKKI
jgi:hypothetical protein